MSGERDRASKNMAREKRLISWPSDQRNQDVWNQEVRYESDASKPEEGSQGKHGAERGDSDQERGKAWNRVQVSRVLQRAS